MAEVSMTIRTTKPEEAVRLAELIKAFFGDTVPVTVVQAPDKPVVKVAPPPQPDAGVSKPAPTADAAKDEVKIDLALIRTKAALALEKGFSLEVRGKLKEINASNITSIKPEQYEDFHNFLETLLNQ